MTTRSRPGYRGRMINVRIDRVVLPNGHRTEFEVIEHPGGAAAVAIDDELNVCLLRQYRHAVGEWLWELPAGRIEPGEPPAQTAKRELTEEAGVVASRWRALGLFLGSPALFAERIHLFLATGLSLSRPDPEPGEVIEVHWFSLDEATEMAERGEIADGKTAAGLQRAHAALAR